MPRRFAAITGTLLVTCSMIGLGIFTTTGILLSELRSPAAVLIAWALGGAVSLCGALAYAELAAMFPFNGGEYQLLSRIYGPALGFVAGWVSLWVGFSAPTAAAAFAFGEYAKDLVPAAPASLALGLVLGLALLHGSSIRWGAGLQSLATALEVLLMLAFIAAGLLRVGGVPPRAEGIVPALRALPSPAFAVALVYVTFAYSGWNAIVYLAGEVRDPGRTIPRSLIGGTLITTALYLGLNAVFLHSAPAAMLAGVVDIARVASLQLWGPRAAKAVSAAICLALVLTAGALMQAGPRVYEAMGQDYPRLGAWMARGRTGAHGPLAAIALQALLSCGLLIASSFEAVLAYAGFLLSVFSGLTIAGVFLMRWREPDRERPYRAWGHPWTSAGALALTAWMSVHALVSRPELAWAGLLTVLSGVVLYRMAGPPPAQRSPSDLGAGGAARLP